MTTVRDGPPAPLEVSAPSVRDLDARTRDRLVVLLALLTGTLTTVVTWLTTRQPLHTVKHSARILTGLLLGAGGGAALVTRARPLAPALQIGLLLAALVTCTLRQRSHASS